MHSQRCIKQVEYGYNTRKLHAGTAQAGYLRLQRYMYDKLPWEARLVGLMGPRGVGKSTMVLLMY